MACAAYLRAAAGLRGARASGDVLDGMMAQLRELLMPEPAPCAKGALDYECDPTGPGEPGSEQSPEEGGGEPEKPEEGRFHVTVRNTFVEVVRVAGGGSPRGLRRSETDPPAAMWLAAPPPLAAPAWEPMEPAAPAREPTESAATESTEPAPGACAADGEEPLSPPLEQKAHAVEELQGPCAARHLPTEEELRSGGEAAAAAISCLCCCRHHLLEYCTQGPGCRRVQTALDVAGGEARLRIADMLRGHVRSLLSSRHGNFVVQKLIEVLHASGAALVAGEIRGSASATARSQFGCRGVSRLLEHCPGHPGVRAVVEELLGDGQKIRELSKHAFAHYVVQSVLEHGLPEQRRRVGEALLEDPLELATHKRGVYVVEGALAHCDEEMQSRLVETLARTEHIRALAAGRGQYLVGAISRRSCELRRVVRGALTGGWRASEEGRSVEANRHGRGLLSDLALLPGSPDEAAGRAAQGRR